MSTIKDIARHTGLSVATVSKFINGGNVLAENRAMLEEAVKKLDFRINQIARGLKTRCSMTVGVLIPRFNNVFFSALLSGIEARLSQQGYSTMICAYQDDPDTELAKLEFLLNKSVDGVIIVPLGAASRCGAALRHRKIPVVMVDRSCEGIDGDVVLSDNFGAVNNAVRYLADRGHRRIGIVLGPEGVFTADERSGGYHFAIRTLGLDPDPALVRRGTYTIDSGNRCLNEFIDMPDRPGAVIITNYEMTIGGVIALENRKVKVPDDISIIGFDNLELAQVIKPPLTMVAQKIDQLGDGAVELLLRRIAGRAGDAVTVKKFATELIERGSVRNLT